MAKAGTEATKDQQFSDVSSKTDLEGRIVQIWRDVLGLETVGVNDNFFELGGHSLLMIHIRNKIAEIFKKKFSVIDLCMYPTISSLADYLMREHRE